MNQDTTSLFRTSCGATSPLELKISGPGWDGVEQHVFEQPFLLVGRNELCGLRLEDDAVSRRHAYLQQLGDRVFCVDLGSRTGIRWGGRSRPAGWLDTDDGVRIGPFTLKQHGRDGNVNEGTPGNADDWDPLQDRREDLPLLPRILIEDGKGVRSQLPMSRVLVLVGNSPDCRIRLRDSGISKYHCSLVRTPAGVWVIDLLSAAGSFLNGQPVPWARLHDGDRLQVGPYVLRVDYQGARSILPSDRSSTTPAADERPDATGQAVPPRNVQVQTLAVSLTEHSANDASGRVTALQAELDQLRERLREAGAVRQQWADSQAECNRLREEIRSLKSRVDELAGLQARLESAEASALELDLIRAERDHWQAETQAIRDRVATDLSEKEAEWRQQLDEAQKQLLEERDSARVLRERLDQESAALQEMRDAFAARNAEHEAVLQQLQAVQEELTNAQQKLHDSQAELEQLHEHKREAETLGQQLEATRSQHDHLSSRAQELESRAAEAERLAGRLKDADEQAERLRGQLQDAETRLAELDTLRTECDRLRDLEGQVAELEALKAQLESSEASALELDLIRGERDHWQAEAQAVRDRIAADLAEKEEEWRQQLDETQKQLLEERETLHAIREHLAQESAALQRVRDDLAARSAAHEAVLQQLQATQEELARSQEAQHGLQAELEQLHEQQREAEALRQQFEDTRSKHDQLNTRVLELETQATEADRLSTQLRDANQETERLREQVRTLESQLAEMAGLQTRLEVAEANLRELDVLRAERDQWQAEVHTLQERIAAGLTDREQLDRLTADLNAAQEERDRLRSQHQESAHSAEQAWGRVAELERQLTEATAAQERVIAEVPSDWEAERRELQTQLEQERRSRDETIQAAVREIQSRAEAAIREVQARAAAERTEWRERLDGAETQIVWERQMFQEQSEQIRRQAATLQAERDRLAARLAQMEASLRGAQPRPPEPQPPVPTAEPDQQRQLALRDRVLAELCGYRLDPPQPTEQARPRAIHQNPGMSGGPQSNPHAIEQGVEAAWAHAAAGQTRPATPPNPLGQVGKQEAEVSPDAREKPPLEPRPSPTETAESVHSTTPPQKDPTVAEGKQTVEELRDWLAQQKKEEERPVWRKILNFVRGK